MKYRLLIAIAAFVALLSCQAKDPSTAPAAKPALQMTVDSLGSTFVRLDLRLVNASSAWILAQQGNAASPSAADIHEKGTRFDAGIRVYGSLEPETEYVLYGVAENEEGTLGSVVKLSLKTWAGSLYSWESSRSGVPFFADLALLYGFMRRNPTYWDEDRLRPFVTWTDPESGQEKWLFDAFLILEGRIPDYPPRTFGVGVKDWDNPSVGMPQANQEDAGRFLDYWFSETSGIKVLDKLVGEAASRIGTPKVKPKVIVMMPDLPAHERYNVNTTSTTYWGKVNGRTMDFSNPEDRRQAYYWYIDETRRRFFEAGLVNIELGGFYIMSEELPSMRSGVGGRGGDYIGGILRDGWEVEAKGWDDIFPAVSDYIHQYHESVCWIPYRSAAGYRYWKEFGIDYAWMQPNYYWDTFGVNPISSFYQQIATYDLAMELEFDDMMMPRPVDRDQSEYTKTRNGETKTETYKDYQTRWRGYIDGMQSAPVYGTKSLAVYQDTDSFNHLRQSSYKEDQDAFNELCRLIAEDPLKEKNR
ncbi:MAG: DUF4855 domain-containing protein [Bacteroidales bacterium]|nr:DUF4855 domain-containing protein [Bacteroidales bacterium]